MHDKNVNVILHAFWSQSQVFLWGENIGTKEQLSRRWTNEHPFATPLKTLSQWAQAHLTGQDAIADWHRIRLPGHTGRPQPSLLAQKYGRRSVPPPHQLMIWDIPVVMLDYYEALMALVQLPPSGTGGFLYDSDLVFWQQIAHFALNQVVSERVIPTINKNWYDEPQFEWHWWAMINLARELTLSAPTVTLINDLSLPPSAQPIQLIEHAISCLIDGYVEMASSASLEQTITKALFSRQTRKRNTSAKPLLDQRQAQKLIGDWSAWINSLPVGTSYRLCLRLDEPAADGDLWRLTFLIQSDDEQSLLIPASEIWHDAATYDLVREEINRPRLYLLSQIALAMENSPIITDHIDQTQPTEVLIAPADAYRFLLNDAPALEKTGIGVFVPDWWTRRRKLKIRSDLSKTSDDSLGFLGKETLFNYQWRVSVGDGVQLSREEFEKLVNLKQPIVQHRGQWVALDERQIEAARAFFEAQTTKEGAVNLFGALHASAEGQRAAKKRAKDDALIEIEAPQVAAEVEAALKKLRKHQNTAKVSIPTALNATLRPYQQRGFQWLVGMRQMGLGACLADDMGLGKTMQTIALWLYERDNLKVKRPALLICPTSVVSNWHQELSLFAPSLRVYAHHGTERLQDDAFTARLDQVDVVLTSYALLVRDLSFLKPVAWDSVTLDEAQNIKNPSTKQAQAARALNAEFKLALTGTPIENRLSELWSIFQFLNPGYLGSRKVFTSRFATPIEKRNDQEAAKVLRQLVAPFILRRVKTDPKVIQDLPEKFENRVFCNLTTEQATLYEAIVRREMDNIAQATGEMERRGAVLRMLVHLKQVCNHPAQYLKHGELTRSGSKKLERLTELVTTIRENEEKALIFTQYARMGKLLQDYLADLTGQEVLFLHGGTPGTARGQMVARFQQADGPPLFVLSLKAGGTGLNLTAATQVFHYDRWYNPAVEDQATDRAYRIGQNSVVQVHKFVCVGTLEERIDALIERKKQIAAQVIGGGEAWISELSDAELRELVMLRAEAVN